MRKVLTLLAIIGAGTVATSSPAAVRPLCSYPPSGFCKCPPPGDCYPH